MKFCNCRRILDIYSQGLLNHPCLRVRLEYLCFGSETWSNGKPKATRLGDVTQMRHDLK